MELQSVAKNRKGQAAKAVRFKPTPRPKDPRVMQALGAGSLSRPGFYLPTAGASANYYAGARTYRNKKLRKLARAGLGLTGKLLLENGGKLGGFLGGVAIVAGAAVAVYDALEDGQVTVGEAIDLAGTGVELASTALPFVMPEAQPRALTEALELTDLAVGVLAQTGEGYQSAMVVPSVFELGAQDHDKSFSAVKKALGPAAGSYGAGLDILETLTDEMLWKSLKAVDARPSARDLGF
ncbi:MAG: hypothetical protein AAGD13_25225 [Pseudomonadota bacterium]